MKHAQTFGWVLGTSLAMLWAMGVGCDGGRTPPPGGSSTKKDATTTSTPDATLGDVSHGSHDASPNRQDAMGFNDASTPPPQDSGVHADAGTPPPECVPYSDTCAQGTYCQVRQGPVLECIAEGTSNVGDSCSQSPCRRGGICLDVGQGPKCYLPCNPQVVNCGTNGTCAGLSSVSFGICETAPTCNPVNPNSCPSNETCQLIRQDGTSACTAAGTAVPPQSCTGPCAHGYMCLNFGAGTQCYQPCDPAANPSTCPNQGTCQAIQGIPWGVCT